VWWRYERKPKVAGQRVRAEKAARTLARDGRSLAPVVIRGRQIATSFWGKAWCDNLESYQDLAYRLDRGRSYVRNGAVLDLKIENGKIAALVSGSHVYKVDITIKALEAGRWAEIKKRSAGQIGSLIELLEGRLSEGVMRIVTDRGTGLFPKPAEIHMHCSCPDYATMCKHVAAVLFGVGARLDEQPQLLFLLRHVNHNELITGAAGLGTRPSTKRKTLSSGELGDVFGIELAQESAPAAGAKPVARGKTAPAPAADAAFKQALNNAPQKALKKRAAPKKKAVARSKSKP
jgi:uncharacterized Zn finger protein